MHVRASKGSTPTRPGGVYGSEGGSGNFRTARVGLNCHVIRVRARPNCTVLLTPTTYRMLRLHLN
jgi:hypothetical protein